MKVVCVNKYKWNDLTVGKIYNAYELNSSDYLIDPNDFFIWQLSKKIF